MYTTTDVHIKTIYDSIFFGGNTVVLNMFHAATSYEMCHQYVLPSALCLCAWN